MKKFNFSNKQRNNFIRIIISLILFISIFIIDKIFKLDTITNIKYLLPFILYLIVYLLIAYDVLIKAFKNIIRGHIFDENFLMCIASIGAFSLAIYRGVKGLEIEGFDEACAVMLFYQIGEFFQDLAVNRSRQSISDLMNIKAEYANLKLKDKVIEVNPEILKVSDIIVIKPGEKIPVDGIVIKGITTIDTKSLTGESLPREVKENDEVISGSINISSLIEVKVTKLYSDSTVSKILEMVETASFYKSKTENFISKFALYYTPIVVAIAFALAIIPSIITKEVDTWIYRALSFLVVSCPCALVISVPLTFFSAIGLSSKHGILIKGSDYIERISRSKTFVFDKTGTLTKGEFEVIKVTPLDKKDEVLRLASIAESNSKHPIAKSIIKAYGKTIEYLDYQLEDISGKGIVATKDNEKIICGNASLMDDYNIEYVEENEVGTLVYVALNNQYIGSILINDTIKEETKLVINELTKNDIRAIMLSGDNTLIASLISKEIGINEYKANLLPQNKVKELEEIINNKNKKDEVCYIGDGINDAPVLMRADVGISMGLKGSDAAIEASDIVLMKDDLRSVLLLKKISKKTMKIVYQNIIFSIAIKFIILALSAFGITNMWFAVFGDVGVAFLAILNALRIGLSYKKKESIAGE